MESSGVLLYRFLDEFETETLFLRDLDKVYKEDDKEVDPEEREEDMQRMRETMMQGEILLLGKI